jgi:site-specific recombinase XerD
MNGGDLASLADIMGHESVETTKAFYAVFAVEDLSRKHAQYSPVSRLGNPRRGVDR